MNNSNLQGRLPYAKPSIEVSDFMVESGIAVSFAGEDSKTAVDFTVAGSWEEQ